MPLLEAQSRILLLFHFFLRSKRLRLGQATVIWLIQVNPYCVDDAGRFLLPEARDEEIAMVKEVLAVWGRRWWSVGLWGGGGLSPIRKGGECGRSWALRRQVCLDMWLFLVCCKPCCCPMTESQFHPFPPLPRCGSRR